MEVLNRKIEIKDKMRTEPTKTEEEEHKKTILKDLSKIIEVEVEAYFDVIMEIIPDRG